MWPQTVYNHSVWGGVRVWRGVDCCNPATLELSPELQTLSSIIMNLFFHDSRHDLATRVAPLKSLVFDSCNPQVHGAWRAAPIKSPGYCELPPWPPNIIRKCLSVVLGCFLVFQQVLQPLFPLRTPPSIRHTDLPKVVALRRCPE